MWVWSYVVVICASDQGCTLYLGLRSCPRAALIHPHLAAACAMSLGQQQHRGSRAASVPMRGGSRRIIPHGRVLISKRFIKMGSGESGGVCGEDKEVDQEKEKFLGQKGRLGK